MFKRISFFFEIHFKKHIILYGIVLFIFLVGVTSGAFTVNAVSSSQIEGLADYISAIVSAVTHSENANIDKMAILFEGLRQYCGFSLLIWFLGLSYIGIPFIVIAFGIKGFLIGFTTGFLVSFYGIRGILFTIACILPQNLIYIPCIIMVAIVALDNAMKSYKVRKRNISTQHRNSNFISYTIKMLIISIILAVGVLYEAFIAPFLLNVFSQILKV